MNITNTPRAQQSGAPLPIPTSIPQTEETPQDHSLLHKIRMAIFQQLEEMRNTFTHRDVAPVQQDSSPILNVWEQPYIVQNILQFLTLQDVANCSQAFSYGNNAALLANRERVSSLLVSFNLSLAIPLQTGSVSDVVYTLGHKPPEFIQFIERLLQINESLPKKFQKTSSHIEQFAQNPTWLLGFLQKAYDNQLLCAFGDIALVTPKDPFSINVQKVRMWLTSNASKVTTINILHKKLLILPKEIGLCTNLQNLDLCYNQLNILPPEIGCLCALQRLYLSDNQLNILPPEIGKLSELQILVLANNRLTFLPPQIGKLSALQKLDISYNQLSSLPLEIGQLSALQRLLLYDNQLSSLPPEIGRLSALKILVLTNNQITFLPPEIGLLSALQRLLLYDNQLSSLPPEIGRLSALQVLVLTNNQLTFLPPEIVRLSALQILVLTNNQLTFLPPEIVRLPALQRLLFSNNPFSFDSVLKLPRIAVH